MTKYHLATFVTAVLLVFSTLPVRSSAAAQKFRVPDVFLKADNVNGGGPCPVTLNFTGSISTAHCDLHRHGNDDHDQRQRSWSIHQRSSFIGSAGLDRVASVAAS